MKVKVFADFDEMTGFLELQDQVRYRVIQVCCVRSLERCDQREVTGACPGELQTRFEARAFLISAFL